MDTVKAAYHKGEVPVAAALVKDGDVISIAHNQVETQNNNMLHAEMVVMQEGCRLLKNKQLPECDLYVTLEPCAMCAGAIAHMRIRRLYFGAYDTKAGAVEHGARLLYQPYCHHQPDIYGGIRSSEHEILLKSFFFKCRGGNSSTYE